MLTDSDVVFFGGGDQLRLQDCLKEKNGDDSPALKVIREKFVARNLTIAGTSAGTTIHSDSKYGMITGGESFYALKDGVHKERDPKRPDDLSYLKDGGFSMVENFILDTHFSDRGREGRIIVLGQYVGVDWAVGMDQNTALVINEEKMEVMGESGVFFFDLRDVKKNSNSIENIFASYLTEGDIIKFTKESEEVTFASFKTSLIGREKYKIPKHDIGDIWSSPDTNEREHPKEFAKVAIDLCDSYGSNDTKGTTYHSPTQTVTFEKVEDTQRFQGYKDDISYISFHRMKINMKW